MDEQLCTVDISQSHDRFCLEIPSSLRLTNNEKQRNTVCLQTRLTMMTEKCTHCTELFILVRRTDERHCHIIVVVNQETES